VFLARVVHVSIGSSVQLYKTVFGHLTLLIESLLGLKAINLFQAFSASKYTVIIDLVVCAYVQPCGMSLEYIPGMLMDVGKLETYESTVVWPVV